MEIEEKPVKFEQFLIVKMFQKIFFMQHFHISRDKSGRLAYGTDLVFYRTFFLHFCFFLGTFVAIFKSFHLGLTNDEHLPVLTIASFFTVRGIFLYLKRHDIMKFLNTLDAEFPPDLAAQRALRVPQVYAEALRRHRYVQFALTVAVGAFCVMPAVVYIFSRDPNGPITVQQKLLSGWIPFGLRESHKAYVFTWFYDVLSSVSGTSYFASFDSLFSAMHGQIIMHMNYLSRQMEQLNWTSENDVLLQQQLRPLIRRHQYLNSLCDQFNDIFKALLMISDFMAATTICFHLYLLTETDDLLMSIRYVGPAVLLVTFIFEVSLRGAQLEEASSQLNETLYNQTWYLCGRQNRKMILIWLKYTQCIKKLNALGLMEVNMMHFTDIMNLAYRLFTFLKTA